MGSVFLHRDYAIRNFYVKPTDALYQPISGLLKGLQRAQASKPGAPSYDLFVMTLTNWKGCGNYLDIFFTNAEDYAVPQLSS